jgi:hypothetical protein
MVSVSRVSLLSSPGNLISLIYAPNLDERSFTYKLIPFCVVSKISSKCFLEILLSSLIIKSHSGDLPIEQIGPYNKETINLLQNRRDYHRYSLTFR